MALNAFPVFKAFQLRAGYIVKKGSNCIEKRKLGETRFYWIEELDEKDLSHYSSWKVRGIHKKERTIEEYPPIMSINFAQISG